MGRAVPPEAGFDVSAFEAVDVGACTVDHSAETDCPA
jgi:hypothetical protein